MTLERSITFDAVKGHTSILYVAEDRWTYLIFARGDRRRDEAFLARDLARAEAAYERKAV